MPAPKGNQYYKLRMKDGRDKLFEKPEDLLKECNKYFQWCLDNPLKEEHIVNKSWIEYVDYDALDDQGNTVTKTRRVTHPYFIATTNKMRPFTLEGLCNFLDISINTFKGYEKREDFMTVVTRARQIIDNHQFEGASAGFLNPSIIAQKLGLVKNQNIKHQGDKDNPIVTEVTVNVKSTGKTIATSEDDVVI